MSEENVVKIQDGKSKKTKSREKKSPKQEIFEWFDTIVFSVVFVFIVLVFVLKTVTVDGNSMNPTLDWFDMVLMNQFMYEPETGDIVVVTKLEQPLIKRIIATEGQEINIDFSQGEVYVDGIMLDEPYINEPTFVSEGMTFPQTVPDGHVFVMGDNRNASKDSRFLEVGFVDNRHVLGNVFLRILPFESFGFLGDGA